MDKIKIAYSWVGPRGPMWNTELPNVLSFADVSSGAKTHSHMWWADDLWQKIFRPHPESYELAASITIQETDKFIFPYSLTWRIPFRSYFMNTTGILEFSHVDGSIIHFVRNWNGYFLIDLSVEAFMEDAQLHAMHSYFEHNGIPLGKIIYLTGCMNSADLYADYCNRYNIPDNFYHRLKIISYPSSMQIFATHFESDPKPEEPEYRTDYVPEKLFLMWNRRYRSHRLELALALEKLKLIDRSLISMGDYDPENSHNKFKNHRHLMHSDLGFTLPVFEKFAQRLPLVIDGETNINQMCEDFNNASRPFYQRTLVSIVTETNFDLNELTLTEKSFKPSKEKHPFIIAGVSGALKMMQELGFKTFSEFWDESYDSIKDPRQRLKAIISVLEYIGSWDNQKILEFRQKVKPILEHNYKNLHVRAADYVSKKIEEHVRMGKP